MKINAIQKMAWGYLVMFFFIAALQYIPGMKAADGSVLNLFVLDWWDDLLHLFSGIWAGVAAWHSFRQSQLYFKIFGTMYGLDGVMGFFLGQGYLDGGIFTKGITQLDLGTRFFANLPHIAIGGLAVLIGFVLSRKYEKRA